jgi:hypothetical protein
VRAPAWLIARAASGPGRCRSTSPCAWRRTSTTCAAGARSASSRLGGDRFHVRVIEFSVQGNHIHLLVEAPDRRALARAIQGFSIRVAKGLNRMMDRSGRVFDDRYHARVLRTPTEVRHAIHYVLDNARKHAAQRGETYPPGYVDPYSSAGAPDLALPSAQTWLLRAGWKRAGP